MTSGRARASRIAMSMRPIGSTHTGQPGPWIMRTVGGSRSVTGVARDRMGVAAAEFHEGVVAAGLDLACDRPRQPGGEAAVAEFVDVLHALLPCPALG